MERSIVTGSGRQQEADRRRQERSGRQFLPSAVRRLPSGFTLLELMIVISIIIILAAVALPQYYKTIMHARETVLRDDLYRMRSLIDQYSADKGKLPQSLDDLVSAGTCVRFPPTRSPNRKIGISKSAKTLIRAKAVAVSATSTVRLPKFRSRVRRTANGKNVSCQWSVVSGTDFSL